MFFHRQRSPTRTDRIRYANARKIENECCRKTRNGSLVSIVWKNARAEEVFFLLEFANTTQRTRLATVIVPGEYEKTQRNAGRAALQNPLITIIFCLCRYSPRNFGSCGSQADSQSVWACKLRGPNPMYNIVFFFFQKIQYHYNCYQSSGPGDSRNDDEA